MEQPYHTKVTTRLLMDNPTIISPFPQPTRVDAVKNHALLLETAARLFAEQGVESVTMSAIAEAAGVGKGTLYRHFENKAALCHALLDHNDRELQDRTLERLRTVNDAPGNLRWLLVEVAAYTRDNEDLLSVGDASGISSLEHPAHWWVRQTIRGLLAQINPPGDLDYITDLLYVMVDARTIHFLRHARGYDMQRINDGLLAAVDRLC
jgi:AcrR family transcriptional regulator